MVLYNNTKAIIREGFVALLDKEPFNKITVRDITEHCKILRNTFYYYYQDIYALLEDTFNTEIERLAVESKSYDSWQKAFLDATTFAAPIERRSFIFTIPLIGAFWSNIIKKRS